MEKPSYTAAVRELYVKTPRGYRWPFSKGLLTETLMNAGMGMEAAMSVSHTVEERLKARKKAEISAAALKRLVVSEVERAFGAELAAKLRKQTHTFEDILVKEGYRRRPFSKGVLARSLEDAGFALKEAYALAKALETDMRQEGLTEITAEELERRVVREIERRYGRSARKRYVGRHNLAGELFVEEAEGEPRVPFSKGVVAQSMMEAGLAPDAAYRLARMLEGRLREEGNGVVSRSRLREMVMLLLTDEAGEDIALRYQTLRAIKRTVRPIHLLIGGVTGTGKSLLASALSYRLGITRLISTDTIREILRATVPADLVPTLHTSSFDAWSALALPKQAQPDDALILQGFRDQVARVAVGLRAIQERGAQERTSLVVEGVHVVPGYLSHPWQNEVIQIPLMLVVNDENIHRDRFILREKETQGKRPRNDYLRHFHEIRLIQNHLIELAGGARIPVIPGEDLDQAIEKCLEVIVQRMQEAYQQALPQTRR
jgi:2-phosphoglycerate kinase